MMKMFAPSFRASRNNACLRPQVEKTDHKRSARLSVHRAIQPESQRGLARPAGGSAGTSSARLNDRWIFPSARERFFHDSPSRLGTFELAGISEIGFELAVADFARVS